MKTAIATFTALWLILAGLAIGWHSSHSIDSESKVACGWVACGFIFKVDSTNGAALNPAINRALSKEVVATNAVITVVNYDQYDSAQSSLVGERIMGLPRVRTYKQ